MGQESHFSKQCLTYKHIKCHSIICLTYLKGITNDDDCNSVTYFVVEIELGIILGRIIALLSPKPNSS